MKKLLALAAVAFLAACQEAPQDKPFPMIQVPGAAYRVNVAEIRVENNTPAAANDVSTQFAVTPAAATEQWVRDHFVAAGSYGYMVVSIDDASVKETPLEKKTGVEGYFTDDQDARYDGRIAATLRIYTGARAMADAEVSAGATRSRTINEDSTLAQREQFYYELTRDLITQFHAQAEPRVRQYFAAYLR